MKTYNMTTYDIYSIVCTILGERPVEADKNWKHHWDQIKRSDQVLRMNKCSPVEKCRACGHTGGHAFGCKLDLSSYAKTVLMKSSAMGATEQQMLMYNAIDRWVSASRPPKAEKTIPNPYHEETCLGNNPTHLVSRWVIVKHHAFGDAPFNLTIARWNYTANHWMTDDDVMVIQDAVWCNLNGSRPEEGDMMNSTVFTRIPHPWPKCRTPGYILTDIPGYEGQRRWVFSISDMGVDGFEVGHLAEADRFTNPIKGEVWAFVGRAGAGKSTIASYLTKSRAGWVRDRLAGPLKEMLKVGLGLTDAQVDGDEKTVPAAELCGMTPRYAMQTLGTEWGRKLIDPDLWIDALVRRCQEATALGKTVVVDDVRFVNEVEALRAIGARIIKIERPGKRKFNLLDWMFKRGQYHPSETGVDKITPDFVIKNNTDVVGLQMKIDMTINDWDSMVPNVEMD